LLHRAQEVEFGFQLAAAEPLGKFWVADFLAAMVPRSQPT
jgi:hypothetical protein